MKVAEVAPAAIVTVLGTVAPPEEADMATGAPPAGAAPDKVTVPVTFPPAATVEGEMVNADKVNGTTVIV